MTDRFKAQYIREEAPPPPITEVIVHLTPGDVRVIAAALTDRYPYLTEVPDSLCGGFQEILKIIEEG